MKQCETYPECESGSQIDHNFVTVISGIWNPFDFGHRVTDIHKPNGGKEFEIYGKEKNRLVFTLWSRINESGEDKVSCCHNIERGLKVRKFVWLRYLPRVRKRADNTRTCSFYATKYCEVS